MIKSNILISSTVLLIFLGLGYGCKSEDDDTKSTTTSTTTSTTCTDATDILEKVLTATDASCKEYVGTYSASITGNKGSSLTSCLVISYDSTADTCSFATNQLPNHNVTETGFKEEVAATDYTFTVTATPTAASKTKALTVGQSEGILLNGVKVDFLSAECYKSDGSLASAANPAQCNGSYINKAYRYDPMSTTAQAAISLTMDDHNAHLQKDLYHYHGDPVALWTNSATTACGTSASPVIGFAADGFPIFGSCFSDSGTIRKATSSYALKSGSRSLLSGTSDSSYNPGGSYDGTYREDYEYTSGSGDLDKCNGMTVNGQYGYYLTAAFPFAVGCFTGTANSTFGG